MANPGTNGHGNGHSGNGHSGNGHVGHGGVRFEPTDVQTGGLYLFALVLTIIVIGAAGGVAWLYDYLSKEADRAHRAIPTLVREGDWKAGKNLPFEGNYNQPLLEGVLATDPAAPRSGVFGYTSLSQISAKTAEEKLSSYGYLDKDKAVAHIPVAVAIEELTTSKMLKVREKTPDGVEIGSVVNPYSFYKSDSSSGRASLGETRK
jgi:hypothetical protein